MKKILVIFLLAFCAVSSIFGNDFSFAFADLDQHTELLWGFLPTLLEAGADYNGFKLIENESTQIRFTVGGGLLQRFIYQEPLTGQPLQDHIHIFDVVQLRWNLRFRQTFAQNFIFTAGYNGTFEKSQDSLLLSGGGIPKPSSISRARGTGGNSDVVSFDKWFEEEMNGTTTKKSTPIYKEFNYDNNVINSFYTSIRYNKMQDTWTANRGWYLDLKFESAPSFLNKVSSFFGITLNVLGGTSLYELKNSDDKNLFSITLLDRINMSWADGSAVPLFYQGAYSLGRKVRGFNSRSYNSNFSIVNNLEVRFAGPEFFIKGIFPRLNVFFDIGYGSGNYFNTGHNSVHPVKADNFLSSTGIQIQMDFFDKFDLGIEVAYLLSGVSLRKPEDKIQLAATFFLDF